MQNFARPIVNTLSINLARNTSFVRTGNIELDLTEGSTLEETRTSQYYMHFQINGLLLEMPRVFIWFFCIVRKFVVAGFCVLVS